MKNTYRKTCLALLLALAMTLGLCGCGDGAPAEAAREVSGDFQTDGGEQALSAGAAGEEDGGYPTGRLAADLRDGEFISSAACAGGEIYLALQTMDETSSADGVIAVLNSGRICRLAPDGTLTELCTLTDGWLSQFVPLEDGSVWYTGWQEAASGEMEESAVRLVHIGADGTPLGDTAVRELPGGGEGALLPGPDGGLVLAETQGFVLLDSGANVTGTAAVSRGFLSQPFTLEDGSVMSWVWTDFENDEGELVRLDTAAMTLETVKDVTEFTFDVVLGGTLEALWVRAQSSADFILYNALTGEKRTAIAWVDLNIDQMDVTGAALLDGGRAVVATREGVYVFPAGYTLAGGGKTTLTLAGVGVSESVRRLVTAFNQDSQEYYVSITDYQDYGAVPEDSALSDRFLYEISVGELPDVIVFSDTTDGPSVENLARKGYLTDLGALIDGDESFDRGDFLENILSAVSVDGTLYTVPLEYEVWTAAAAVEVTGGGTSCTLDELRRWMEAWPGLDAMCETTRNGALEYLLAASAESLLTGDGQALDGAVLGDILSFAAGLPENMYGGGGNILVPVELFTAEDTGFVQSRLGQTAFSLVGLPCAGGGGHLVRPYRELAIASDTDCPEGCWALLRYALSPEYQNALATGGIGGSIWEIPLRADALAAAEDYAARCQGLEEPDPAFDTLLRGVDRVYRVNSTAGGVIAVIQEEAGAYFTGQKTLDDTLASIQSRASLYMAERE